MEDTVPDLPVQSLAKFSSDSKPLLLKKNSSHIGSCRICLSSILSPATLTCGHKFCEQCLYQYWLIRNKPDFIICPLCRACIFNVDFAEKEKLGSTADLRNAFASIQHEISPESNPITLLCLKMSIILPVIYLFLEFLRSPALQLFNWLQLRIGEKM